MFLEELLKSTFFFVEHWPSEEFGVSVQKLVYNERLCYARIMPWTKTHSSYHKTVEILLYISRDEVSEHP